MRTGITILILSIALVACGAPDQQSAEEEIGNSTEAVHLVNGQPVIKPLLGQFEIVTHCACGASKTFLTSMHGTILSYIIGAVNAAPGITLSMVQSHAASLMLGLTVPGLKLVAPVGEAAAGEGFSCASACKFAAGLAVGAGEVPVNATASVAQVVEVLPPALLP
jgi:hypothetical protein